MRDVQAVLREKESAVENLNWEIEALRVAADILKDDRSVVRPAPLTPGSDIGVDYCETKRLIKEFSETAEPVKVVRPISEQLVIDAIADVQKAHITDLRVLLDKANAREEQLAAMVKMVMEERYYRPNVTGPPRDNKTTTALPPEHLSDVEAFDEKADQEQSDEQAALQKEMQEGLNELLTEHKEAHQE